MSTSTESKVYDGSIPEEFDIRDGKIDYKREDVEAALKGGRIDGINRTFLNNLLIVSPNDPNVLQRVLRYRDRITNNMKPGVDLFVEMQELGLRHHLQGILDLTDYALPSVNLEGAIISDSLFMSNVEVRGDVSMSRSNIHGALYQRAMKIGGSMIQFDSKIDGDVYQRGSQVQGMVFQRSMEIEGFLDQGHMRIGRSLDQLESKIKEDLSQTGLMVEGDLTQDRAVISGDLYRTGRRVKGFVTRVGMVVEGQEHGWLSRMLGRY